jgi:hypothetical protein
MSELHNVVILKTQMTQATVTKNSISEKIKIIYIRVIFMFSEVTVFPKREFHLVFTSFIYLDVYRLIFQTLSHYQYHNVYRY